MYDTCIKGQDHYQKVGVRPWMRPGQIPHPYPYAVDLPNVMPSHRTGVQVSTGACAICYPYTLGRFWHASRKIHANYRTNSLKPSRVVQEAAS